MSTKKLQILDSKLKYDPATTSEDGLMSSTDKSKLDSVETGANKTVVDNALSATSNNPVQNKVVTGAINTLSASTDAHTSDINIHVTSDNKSNWNTAYTHSQAGHARVDATNVSKSTSNGNVLINGTETNVYSHPNSGVTAGTYKSVTVNANGHVTAGTNPTTLAGYGITDAEPKGAASNALTSAKEYTDSVAAGKSDKTHNHDSVYDAKGAANAALNSAKSYADSAANAVKNDLLNGAGAAYDTLKELGDLIDTNTNAIDALEVVAAGKADKSHTHTIANVTGLQSALDGKAASFHGTHVEYSSTTPVMDGTASVGTAGTVARSDHKHPTDTSRAAKTDFDSHTGNTTAHITSAERSNWNAAKTHADSAHAPFNAEKNQNAFSNVVVGSTTVAADSATDTLTLVGNNITLTPDATNDKITFTVADGSTSNKGIVQLTNSTSSTSTTTAATPNSVKSAYDLANTAKSAADTAQATANDVFELVGNTAVSTQISNYAAPKAHASSATTYGVSSASNYGHAKASGTTPKANGTAAVGSETSSFARGDHVHPLQTSISITNTTPSSATTYYPVYTSSTSGNQTLRANADLYYYDTGTVSYLNVGSENNRGGLTLHNNNYYVDIIPITLTRNRTNYLPDVDGTLLNSGNYNDYAPSKTGTGASGAWDISITGDAATANKLKNYYSSRPSTLSPGIIGDGSVMTFKCSSKVTDATDPGDGHVLHFNWDSNSGYDAQLLLTTGYSGLKYRGMSLGVWSDWVTSLDSDNYTTYTVKKDGTGASGTWGINISGSASTVNITNTTPSSATTYYPVYALGVSGSRELRANVDFYYYDTGTASYLNVGSGSNIGGLTLHNSNYYANIIPTTLTANRTSYLPNVSGTLLNTGNYTDYAAQKSHAHVISDITNIVISASQPSSPTTGMLWIDIS